MKFKDLDERYKEQRQAFSDETGPRELWSVIDHWPLYCGTANLGRVFAITDLLRSTLDVPGHVAEFGLWRGATTSLLAKTLRIFDPHGSKVIHGFDSFEGLGAFVEQDGVAKENKGRYLGSYEELKKMLDLYEIGDDVEFHVGLIEETLPELMAQQAALSFSFVYCDTDLYESTRLILEQLHPRLSKGGLFVFDEWNDASYPGEGLAANEFLEQHGHNYEVHHVSGARQPTMYLRKIKY